LQEKNGCKKRILCLVGISILVLFTFSVPATPVSKPISNIAIPSKVYSSSLIDHDPISITKADDFEKMGFEGNGTEINPYIIEDLSIHAKFDGIGINIISTSVFFVIRNCEIYSYDLKSGTGVYFEKVVNGIVVDCNIHTLALGISMLKSEQCTIKTNTLSKLGTGIYLTQSLWVTLDKNYLSESVYGMHLNKMDFSDLIANKLDDCNYGILIENGVRIQVLSNEVTGSFFGVYFHNTVQSLSENNTVQYSQYGVYYAYSQDCTLSLSDLMRNRYGISLIEIDGGTISSNQIKYNTESGIHIKNSHDLTIRSNTVFYNTGVGLYFTGVTNAEVHENEIGYNTGTNAVDFVGASIKGLMNNWDTNAWSDYKGTFSYSISGDRGSVDNDPHYIIYLDSPSDISIEAPATMIINWSASAFRPHYYSIKENGVVIDDGAWDGSNLSTTLSDYGPGTYVFAILVDTKSGVSKSDTVIVSIADTTAPEWIQVPEDQIVECGSSLSYQLEASDFYGIAKWWVNNTEFKIDDGFLQNISTLYYGIFHLEVRAYDPSDNYVSHNLSVVVTDSILPTIESPDDIVITEGELGHTIVWNVFDSNPQRYEIFMDEVSIESGEWISDMTTIQYSLDGLSSGNYIFSIILTDLAGNVASDEVQVTVDEPPSTETSTETETPSTSSIITSTEPPTTPDEGEAGPNMITLGLIGIGTGSVIVIVFIVLKRK